MQQNWLVLNINKKYFLRVGNKTLRCQIGSKGLRNAVKKVEGDKTTPIGKWYFRSLYYRSDRVLRPKLNKKNFSKIIIANFTLIFRKNICFLFDQIIYNYLCIKIG